MQWCLVALMLGGISFPIVAMVGCSWWGHAAVKPVVPAPPTPKVGPDLQPGSADLLARMKDLLAKMEASKDRFAAEMQKLVDLAAKNNADVIAQKQAVAEALKQYDALAAEFVACQEQQNKLNADLQAKLDALQGEAASARKYEVVLEIAGMAFCLILMGALVFAPLPALIQGIKWYLFSGLAGALVIGVIAKILEALARPIIIGSILLVVLGAVALVVWLIHSGTLKVWLQKMGLGVKASPDAVNIATTVQSSGTVGLGAVLDEVGAKVPLKPTASTGA